MKKLFLLVCVLLLSSCLGSYDSLPDLNIEIRGEIVIDPFSDAVIIFRNKTSEERKVSISVDEQGTEQYQATIKSSSTWAISTFEDGKYLPKKFAPGNLFLVIDNDIQPLYTVAAIGVTYITISESGVSIGETGIVVNVDVILPQGPFEVDFDKNMIISGAISVEIPVLTEYLREKTDTAAIVRNDTGFNEPLLVTVEDQKYGTQILTVPYSSDRTQSVRTIIFSNFAQIDANQSITAVTIDGRSKTKTMNIVRGHPINTENDDGLNYVAFYASDFVDLTPQPIEWTVNANGGPPLVNTLDEYTTSMLFIEFDKNPGNVELSNFSTTSANTTLDSLIKISDKSYQIAVTVTKTEQLELNCDLDVKDDTKLVNVYKKDDPVKPPIPEKSVTRIILYNLDSVTAQIALAAAFKGSVREPETMIMKTNDVNLFTGVFLSGEQPRASDLRNQPAANWRILEITGGDGNVEFVKVTGTNKIVKEVLSNPHIGNGSQSYSGNVAIRVKNSWKGTFTLSAMIPSEHGGGDPPVSKSYEVTVTN